jgi:hypothetical protein
LIGTPGSGASNEGNLAARPQSLNPSTLAAASSVLAAFA